MFNFLLPKICYFHRLNLSIVRTYHKGAKTNKYNENLFKFLFSLYFIFILLFQLLMILSVQKSNFKLQNLARKQKLQIAIQLKNKRKSSN